MHASHSRRRLLSPRWTAPLPLIAAGFALIAAAQGQTAEPASPELPAGVTCNANIVYATVGEKRLLVDLYLPAPGDRPHPAVVYIHGGAWLGGDRHAFKRQAIHMATVGFAGACIEYRLSSEAHYPAALYDCKAAVRWLRSNAAKYGIDPDRIAAAGGSAGGQLAALLGTTEDAADFEGNEGATGVSSRVAAVAVFNPVLDFADLAAHGKPVAVQACERFLGASYATDPALWRSASPICHVSRDAAPFLSMHGEADTTVPYAQSVRMVQQLKEAGVRAEILGAPGAEHAFFNKAPWYEPTLERMERFFRDTLREMPAKTTREPGAPN